MPTAWQCQQQHHQKPMPCKATGHPLRSTCVTVPAPFAAEVQIPAMAVTISCNNCNFHAATRGNAQELLLCLSRAWQYVCSLLTVSLALGKGQAAPVTGCRLPQHVPATAHGGRGGSGRSIAVARLSSLVRSCAMACTIPSKSRTHC